MISSLSSTDFLEWLTELRTVLTYVYFSMIKDIAENADEQPEKRDAYLEAHHLQGPLTCSAV